MGFFSNLIKNVVSDVVSDVVSEKPLFDYEVMSDGNIRLKACKMEGGEELIIPDTIEGKKVTVMGRECMGHSVISRVICPKYLEVIEEKAFRKSSVREIVLNEGLRTIGDAAFNNTASLNTLVMPDTVTEIGKELFVGSGVETVKLSKGLSSFPEECFAISGLKEITIPGNIKKVPQKAFRDCFKLETVILEEGVEEIGIEAFHGDHKLKRIVMPASLKEIAADFVEIYLQNAVYEKLFEKSGNTIAPAELMMERFRLLGGHYGTLAKEILKIAQKAEINLMQVLSDTRALAAMNKLPVEMVTCMQAEAMKAAASSESPMVAVMGMNMSTMAASNMANGNGMQMNENSVTKALEELAKRRAQTTQMVLEVKPGSYAEQYAQIVGFEYVSA